VFSFAKFAWCLSLSLGATLLFLENSNGQMSTTKAQNRPVTVPDAIGMTVLADSDYRSGDSSSGRVAHFSADGKQFVVVLRKGNLERNTNEDSMMLYHTADAFHSPKSTILLQMSSSSNRPAISKLRWLADNKTLSFVGESPGEIPQVYTINPATRHIVKLTNHPTPIVDYDMSSDHANLLFVADPPSNKGADREEVDRHGIAITTQSLDRLLAGNFASQAAIGEQLFRKSEGKPAVLVPIKDYIFPNHPFVALSHDGRHALIRVWVGDDFPGWWADYDSRTVQERVKAHRAGERLPLMRFLILDMAEGSLKPLLDTPMDWYNETAVWEPDDHWIDLITRLPLEVAEPAERAERAKNLYDVRVKLPSMEIEKIQSMNSETAMNLEVQRRAKQNKETDIDVALEEDINTPPKIYVSDQKTHEKHLLLDLNPQFVHLNLGKVEAIEWKGADGHTCRGGLYWPLDYTPGKRYPLVIQTHGFDSKRFSMDGLNDWSSAFAARPLAAAGFMVLQAHSLSESSGTSKGKYPGSNPRQAAKLAAMAAYEGAIEKLDSLGLVDRNRVGIIGFSRSVAFVAYTLTHSQYGFSAAVLTDGTDAGYFQHIALGPSGGEDDDALNGAQEPFGDGLKQWLRESPSFNLDKVQAPVRLVALQPGSLLESWEWFVGLKLQHKPVDFVYLPDAVHLVVKPWERMVTQQGLVDWFRFWLKGEEDPDPAKAGQYALWREMRKEGSSPGSGK
jgi:dipeptidyl aminopeptidase/acylaminoacyl peptidase